MKHKFLTCLLTLSVVSYAQISTSNNVFDAKEYSKDIALYDSKNFLFNHVLHVKNEPIKFEVIPLAAASSGELTTLIYKSQEKEGLILGFYGSYLKESGVAFTGFGFKALNKEQATEFLNKIQDIIDNEQKYLRDNSNSNNIVFRYEDIDVLISYDGTTNIRLFYQKFDSTWEKTAFERSHRRFERKKSK
jgi:hypothetical protein